MLFAADYPFLDVLWTLLVFFAWVIWFWILITILADIFRRHDIGGGKKALWVVFLIVLPFVGVLIYLIANNDGMAERSAKEARTSQAQFDDYVKTVAGGRLLRPGRGVAGLGRRGGPAEGAPWQGARPRRRTVPRP